MKTLIGLAAYAFNGVCMYSADIFLDEWEFWGILVSVVLIDAISHIDISYERV